MLPSQLHPLFWDYDVSEIDWLNHKDFIVGRVLRHGRWDDVKWLRSALGDEGLRNWLLAKEGRGLDPRQLRFWEVILDLPKESVDAWLQQPSRRLWHERTRHGLSH